LRGYASLLAAAALAITGLPLQALTPFSSDRAAAAPPPQPQITIHCGSTGGMGNGPGPFTLDIGCLANAGDSKLVIFTFRHDADPGQSLLLVTDIDSGAAWTLLGHVQADGGLDLVAYAQTYLVNERSGVRFTFSHVRTNQSHFSSSFYNVANSSGYHLPAVLSSQPAGGTTVSQPDFTPASSGEFILSVVAYTAATSTSLGPVSGSNPPFFTVDAFADRFAPSVIPSFWVFGAYADSTSPTGPRVISADHAVARAGLVLFGLKPLAPPPDFGEAFPWMLGFQPSAAFSPDPVNLATGSFTFQVTDIGLPGRVLPFSFARTYNAADQVPGPFGPGWTHSYNWSVSDNLTNVVLRRGDGRRDVFTRNPDGSYADPPDTFDVLSRNVDGTLSLTLVNQTRYDFTLGGQLARIVEPAGNQLSLAYLGSNLATILDTVGRQVSLAYDANNHLTSLRDSVGRTVTYGYDASGRLSQVIDKAGSTWAYAYDGSSRHITTVTDPDGRVRVTNTYDGQGRVVQQRDGLGALTTFTYGASQTMLTDPRGHGTTYSFDSRGRELSQADTVGAATYTLSYTYDAQGNRTNATDRNGNRTDFSYDARGNLLTKTDPSPDGVAPHPLTTFAYDAKNNLTRISDAAGFSAAFGYDGATNVLLSVTRQIDASTSATTRYEYADVTNPGLATWITSPRGNTGPAPDPTYATTLAYDSQGNLARRTDPDGARTTFTYDAVGRLVSFVDPDGNAVSAVPADHTWRVSYDAQDRELARTDPLGNTVSSAYDGAGNRTAVSDRNANLTRYSYDANARLATVQQRPAPIATPAVVYTTQVARDANGNATLVTQANGVATDYTFDALSRLSSVSTHPTVTTTLTTSYVLDGNGQPTARTTGDGVSVSYRYDALSRLVSVSGPALAISYGYDPLGRRTRMTDSTGVTSYSYDGLGRVTSMSAPTGTLGYGYDLDGNRTRLAYSASDAVSYAYSPGGRLTTVTDWAARVSRYSYQASGLVSGLSYPNGMTASYSYDRAQRLTGLTYTLGRVIGSERYTLDPEGNRTALSDVFGTTPEVAGTMSYDGLNRLTAMERHVVANGALVSNETFSLDPASNISSRTGPPAAFGYDGANRVTSDGTRAFVWDDADRLSARGSDTFSYDPLSRLTNATVAGVTRSYAYDGDGLLRSRTQGTTATAFLYDSSVAPAPLLQVGSERLVYGLGPLYQVHADASYDTLVRDGLGSVRLTVSGSANVTGAFDYTAYGAPGIGGFGASLLGFAGELRDPSGLIYLRSRWYDPQVGRLTVSDSIRGTAVSPVTLNAFAYAADSPLKNVDPSGLCTDPGGSGIRFCINAFIPQDSMLGFSGDSRGALSNGGSYRFQQMVTRAADGSLRQATMMGISRFGPFEREAEQGVCGGRGNAGTLTLTCSASDGLLFGAAPWVGYYLQIRESASGGTVQHVFASAWPSLEVWQYSDSGSPRLLFFNNAAGRGALNTGWIDQPAGSGK
jgi:RHS repeat-associated protein